MAEDDQDQSQKTEEPTQRRIEEAVKKGQVAFSREVNSFLILLVLTISIVWLFPGMMHGISLFLSKYIAKVHDIPLASSEAQNFAANLIFEFLAGIAPFVFILIIAIFGSSFMQNGIIFSTEPITPKLEKISPLKGLKRMFSMKSFMEFIKGLIKITAIGAIGTIAVWPYLSELPGIIDFDTFGIVGFISNLALRIMIGAVCFMAIVAVMDYMYQRYDYLQNLRMSKQELKEEMKQSEGDPQIKAKLKQIRQARARERMMAAVPEADVVITNPTHFAVALKYDQKTMEAPMITAKGADFIAGQIRKTAEEHDVPIVENPPLARALYDSGEIDQEIPIEQYHAVAEVIAYVFGLRSKKAA